MINKHHLAQKEVCKNVICINNSQSTDETDLRELLAMDTEATTKELTLESMTDNEKE